MSRKEYDATNDTLSLIAGRESVDVGLNSTSPNPVRNSALYAEFQKTYRDTDTLENALADSDNFPFFDISANAKRKTTWANIVAKIKAAFTNATTSAAGLMSAADKTKLNNIALSNLNVWRYENRAITNGYVTLPYPTGYSSANYFWAECDYIPGGGIYMHTLQRASNQLVVYVRNADGSMTTGTIPAITVLAIR